VNRPAPIPTPVARRTTPALPRAARRRERQRGAVLLFGMIALVVLLVGTAALVRSMNTSVFTAGNYAFKRDLTNQGERAVAAVLEVVQTGALSTAAAREVSDPARNYSAQLLATNPQGIPLALLSDAQFAGVGVASNDISISDMGISIRYVVDRVSAAAGPALPANSMMAGAGAPAGSSASELANAMDSSSAGAGAVPQQVVYRVSIRVEGPRRTQSYYQTTLAL
jgi:type IV pilus assembly protein PilX